MSGGNFYIEMKKRVVLCMICVWALLIVGIGCNNEDSTLPVDPYSAAVEDAISADADEIYGGLIAITEKNDMLEWKGGKVKVVTFTSYPDSYPEGETIKTNWGETWVTVVPELKTFYDVKGCTAESPILRIEQVLGLPQGSGNKWFAEMWVNPDDLYRPCPDNEINDSICELTFPVGTTFEHIEWFNIQYDKSYGLEKSYPWTRLGYTYDWGNPNDEIGLSEFIIRKNAEVAVEKLESFEDYLF